MYFCFLLHRWPHISRAHLGSKCVTLFLSPLSACLLLSHSSRATRCADVPLNEASSSKGSSATVLLEQLGEPRRQRWGKADSSQSSLMTPVGNTEHRVYVRTEQEGDNKKNKGEKVKWSDRRTRTNISRAWVACGLGSHRRVRPLSQNKVNFGNKLTVIVLFITSGAEPRKTKLQWVNLWLIWTLCQPQDRSIGSIYRGGGEGGFIRGNENDLRAHRLTIRCGAHARPVDRRDEEVLLCLLIVHSYLLKPAARACTSKIADKAWLCVHRITDVIYKKIQFAAWILFAFLLVLQF